MKVYEILCLNAKTLKVLHDFGIKMSDYEWVELYGDYAFMRKNNEKMAYIVATLSSKYKIKERKIFKIIRALKQECQIHALE